MMRKYEAHSITREYQSSTSKTLVLVLQHKMATQTDWSVLDLCKREWLLIGVSRIEGLFVY